MSIILALAIDCEINNANICPKKVAEYLSEFSGKHFLDVYNYYSN